MFRVEYKLYGTFNVIWCADPFSLINELLYLRSKNAEITWVNTFVVAGGNPVFPDTDNEPLDDQGLPF